MTRQIRVQELVGRRVVDVNGKVAGRIEEIRAVWRGDDCFVEDFELGTAALFERLGLSARRLVGWRGRAEPIRIPWQQLDLSDPETPRMRCAIEEL